jgi:hypothetical protein
MATIVVFASSLFIALILVFTKSLELKHGKRNIGLELISRFDSKADNLIASLKFRGLQLVQTIRYILFVQIEAAAKELFNQAHEKIRQEYKTRQSAIMGRKDITNNGSASFYLKKITEDKSNGEKGKIEDSL